MVSTAKKPTNTQMKKWDNAHYFSTLENTYWDPIELCYTREQRCQRTEGCDAIIQTRMYLDPRYYRLFEDKIESENLHPTYPMYRIPNGKPYAPHKFNTWDLLEEDMQQTTTPFLPFHPPDFDYEKPAGWR